MNPPENPDRVFVYAWTSGQRYDSHVRVFAQPTRVDAERAAAVTRSADHLASKPAEYIRIDRHAVDVSKMQNERDAAHAEAEALRVALRTIKSSGVGVAVDLATVALGEDA